MLYDSHMHTPLCKHARGLPEEYGQVARGRGLAGITVTCHNALPDGLAARLRMGEDEFSRYLDLVSRARELLAPHTDVRLGLEADYLSGLEGYLEKQLASAPFDYVLGSVHWHMHEWQDRFWTNGQLQSLYEVYFEQLARSAESRLFDCLAHPDLVKNASPAEWAFDPLEDLVKRVLDRIAATGVAMELNTSGRNKSYAEFNPGPPILALMLERGIPVVLGSDAHTPERAGEGFADALQLLEQIGFRQVSLFKGRQRYAVSIELARASLVAEKVSSEL